MEKTMLRVTYPRAFAGQPYMQRFMEWAHHAGITVNIRGSSVTEETAMFVLDLACHNEAMFREAQQQWRGYGMVTEELPG